MTKPSNLSAIEDKTGIAWSDWVSWLDEHGGRELPHRDIAGAVHAKLAGSLDNAGWWAQSIAVAYEQHIGRRLPGQRSDGSFEAAVSKTVGGDMDAAMDAWLRYIRGQHTIGGVALSGQPSVTRPARGRHWAVNLADGSRLNADCYPKSDGKTTFTVTHAKLSGQQAAERWREYWQTVLPQLPQQ